MNTSEQNHSSDRERDFLVLGELAVGAILGALAYMFLARIVIQQTELGCFETGWVRGMFEGTMFLAWILAEAIVPSESIFYELLIYGLSSLPYAVLGGSIATKSRAKIAMVASFVLIYTCLALLMWGLFAVIAFCG